MSNNVVKYPFVNMQGKEARSVSYEKPGSFSPLEKPRKVVVRDAEEVAEELEKGFSIEEIFKVLPSGPVKVGGDQADADDGFTAGLHAEEIDKEADEIIEKAHAQADEIVSSAREQADEIVVEARKQADDVMSQAHAEGFEAGKEEGIAAAGAEIDAIRAELEDERRTLEEEYAQKVSELEPQFAGLVAGLLEKLTGVVGEEYEDIILHLIKSGLNEVRKTDHIIVRVSQEDILTAESHKKDFLERFEGDVAIDIQGQEGLQKNECFIETDSQMLDAGLKTQLDNLIAALRLLSQ